MEHIDHAPDANVDSFVVNGAIQSPLYEKLIAVMRKTDHWSAGPLYGSRRDPWGKTHATLYANAGYKESERLIGVEVQLTDSFGTCSGKTTAFAPVHSTDHTTADWMVLSPLYAALNAATSLAIANLRQKSCWRMYEIFNYRGAQGSLLIPYGATTDTPSNKEFPNWGFVTPREDIPYVVKLDLCKIAYNMAEKNLKRDWRRSRVNREWAIRRAR